MAQDSNSFPALNTVFRNKIVRNLRPIAIHWIKRAKLVRKADINGLILNAEQGIIGHFQQIEFAMKFIRGLHNLTQHQQGCVLTIGNFDGVHRGHQALLRHLRQAGSHRHLPVVVMVFEPQPLELFQPEAAPARLTRLREKLEHLEKFGVDEVVCINFDQDFAKLTAENFISELLVKRLNVKLLAIGDDFRFGAGRRGDFLLLQQAAKQYGFDVVSTETYIEQGKRISSTAVRQALANSDFPQAEILLGRPWSITGRVVHGDALGRTLGFPTANIPLKRRVTPVKGVFAVEVYGVDKQPLAGVANIGTRPTIKGLRQQLEVHLLDTQRDLYGKRIQVVIKHKIRDEQRFASLDALTQQIAQDVETARNFFVQRTTV